VVVLPNFLQRRDLGSRPGSSFPFR
jgi:hypothetical protein